MIKHIIIAAMLATPAAAHDWGAVDCKIARDAIASVGENLAAIQSSADDQIATVADMHRESNSENRARVGDTIKRLAAIRDAEGPDLSMIEALVEDRCPTPPEPRSWPPQ